jgi:hypothetical protein
VGQGTYTKLDGTSACGNLKPGETMVAALHKPQYQKSWCGKCVPLPSRSLAEYRSSGKK